MTRLVMPDLDHLGFGDRRDFVGALWDLYREAGEPSARSLADGSGKHLNAHQVSAFLHGTRLPDRGQLSTLIRLLRQRAMDVDTDLDINTLVAAVNDAWRKAKRPEGPSAPMTPVPAFIPPSTTMAPTGSPVMTRERFVQLRRGVGSNVGELIEKCVAEEERYRFDKEIPLFTRRGWIPSAPLPLDQVRLSFSDIPRDDFLDAKNRLAAYWPAMKDVAVPSYHAAVRRHDAPKSFFNGVSFRLLHAEPAQNPVQLRFGMGTYFDGFDTCEPLGFEAALRFEESRGATVRGPYRDWLGDPFDLTSRCAVPGVNTLTIRRSGKDVTFYLHQRTSVATAVGTVHVVPAGEFQPSSQQPRPKAAELDLRSTIIREYAEEFLGHEDVLEQRVDEPQIDFVSDRRFNPLSKALRGGGAKTHYLGLGLYPLTWKPEILLVSVFEAELFDRLFDNMVEEVIEGRLVVTTRLKHSRYAFRGKKGIYEGLPFNAETVGRYAGDPTTLPAARGCLTLAWRHRRFLGIGD